MTYEMDNNRKVAKANHKKDLVDSLTKTLDSLRSAQVYEISNSYKNIRACLCASVTVIVSITLQEYVPLLIIVFLVFVTRDESRLHKTIIHVHLAIIADEKDTLEREQARKEWQAFRETPEGKKLFETCLATSAADLVKFADKYKVTQKEFDELKQSSKPVHELPPPLDCQEESKYSPNTHVVLNDVPDPLNDIPQPEF